MREGLSSAIVAGFQEAKLDQYFQQVSSFTERLRNDGFLIQPESINALVRGLGEADKVTLRGQAALQATTQILPSLQSSLYDGTGPGTALMLKALGVTSGTSLADARKSADADPAAAFGKFLASLQEAGSGIKSNDGKSYFAQSIFKSLGVKVNQQRGEDLMTVDPDVIKRALEKSSSAEGDSFMNERGGAFGKVAGLASFEAGMRQREIAVGGNDSVRRMVQTVSDADLRIVERVLPMLTSFVTTAVEMAEKAFQTLTGGAGGFFDRPIDPSTGVEALAPAETPGTREGLSREEQLYRLTEVKMLLEKRSNQARVSLLRDYRTYRDDSGSPLSLPSFEMDRKLVRDTQAFPGRRAPLTPGNAALGASLSLGDTTTRDTLTGRNAMRAAAHHLQQAAGLLGQGSDDLDSANVLGESEARGGH